MEHRDLAMTVGTYGRGASIYNLVSQCLRFGLTTDAARKEIDDVVRTVLGWRIFFRARGVPAKDIEYIAPAFLPESFFFAKPP